MKVAFPPYSIGFAPDQFIEYVHQEYYDSFTNQQEIQWSFNDLILPSGYVLLDSLCFALTISSSSPTLVFIDAYLMIPPSNNFRFYQYRHLSTSTTSYANDQIATPFALVSDMQLLFILTAGYPVSGNIRLLGIGRHFATT